MENLIKQIKAVGFTADIYEDSLYIYSDDATTLESFEADHFPIEGYEFIEVEEVRNEWGMYRAIFHQKQQEAQVSTPEQIRSRLLSECPKGSRTGRAQKIASDLGITPQEVNRHKNGGKISRAFCAAYHYYFIYID